MSDGVDYVGIEPALVAWVLAGSGLAAGQVVLADAGPRPTGTYASIAIGDERQTGIDNYEQSANYLALANQAISAVDAAANTLAIATHLLKRGDGPVRLFTTGVAPGGLAVATDYWVIYADASRVKLADSFVHALAGTAIDITGVGTGAHSIHTVASVTRRVGEEALREIFGDREIDVEIQVISATPTGGASAHAIASKFVLRTMLYEVDSILEAAGLAILRSEPARRVLPTQQLVVFEPRSIVRFTMSCVAQASEKLGVIEAVTGTANGQAFRVTSDA